MGRRYKVWRPIAAMAKKIREARALLNQPRDSERYALDYETMTRPFTGKRLPLLAWRDVRTEKRLFTHLCRLKDFGIGRMVTRKSWVWEYDEPCYWTITRVEVDHMAEEMDHGKAWGYLTFRGQPEKEAREVEKVMYHDWRVVPKHEEEEFKKFTPVVTETVRYVSYPPLLRAMLFAQSQKEGQPISEEPMVDLAKGWAYEHENLIRPSKMKKLKGTPV